MGGVGAGAVVPRGTQLLLKLFVISFSDGWAPLNSKTYQVQGVK